jgi:hypothetical protein
MGYQLVSLKYSICTRCADYSFRYQPKTYTAKAWRPITRAFAKWMIKACVIYGFPSGLSIGINNSAVMNPNLATTTSVSDTFPASLPVQSSDRKNAVLPESTGIHFRKRHHLFLACAAFLVTVFASMAAAATVASNHVGC